MAITFSNPPIKIQKMPTTSKKFEDMAFSFCFEHASLKGGRICFDNPDYDPTDLIKLIKCLKDLSKVKVSELEGNFDLYHFHDVNLSHRAYLKSILKNSINFDSGDISQLPTLYSIEVFTDSKRYIAPRLIFYVLSLGIAKIVYFDYHHLLFSKNYPTKEKIPDNWYEHYV